MHLFRMKYIEVTKSIVVFQIYDTHAAEVRVESFKNRIRNCFSGLRGLAHTDLAGGTQKSL